MSTPGSLNLLAPIPLEAGIQALSVVAAARTDVMNRGFIFPPRPQQAYQGVLPMNLVHLTDEQLGDTLNQIAGWLSFAQSELAQARAAREEAKAKMELTKSRLRLAIKATAEKRTSNPEMDDIVISDQRFIEAQRNHIYCEAVHDYTKQLVDMGQRDWETVSRRITQRGQDIDRGTRGSNVGSVPVMSSSWRRP